jgi:hypothetical protein
MDGGLCGLPHADLDPKDVAWWIDQCSAGRSKEPWEVYSQLHKLVNLMGVDCVIAEEFCMKYGAEGLLSQEDLPIPLFSSANSKLGQLCLYVSLKLFG